MQLLAKGWENGINTLNVGSKGSVLREVEFIQCLLGMNRVEAVDTLMSVAIFTALT